MEQLEEFDIKRMVRILIQNISFILTSILLAGIIAFVYSETMITPTYQSSVTMYVNNNNRSTMLSKSQTSGADMQASQMLVNTYTTIIQSDTVMNEISSEVNRRYGIDYSPGEILSMLSADSVNDTEIFEVSITGFNPEHTAIIANVIADVAPDVISNFVEASTVKIIDTAVTGVRVAPNISRNTLIGLLIGLIYSCAFVILRESFDTRVKNETDLERWFHKSVLGTIPEIGDNKKLKSKYGYYRRSYGYGGKYVRGGRAYAEQYYGELPEASENDADGASEKK